MDGGSREGGRPGDVGGVVRGERPPQATSSLARRLRAAREQHQWTQTQLAEVSRVPQGTISRLESGTMRTCNSRLLVQLAEALGVSCDWLLEREA